MRVLWLAVVPSLYDEGIIGGWIGSLEHIIRKYNNGISLGIVFEHTDTEFRVEKNGVVYYPVNPGFTWKEKICLKFNWSLKWQKLCPKFLKAIEDFHPDVIHCFGSESPYGLIAKNIDIPIIIHMQGFLNVYHPFERMAFDDQDIKAYFGWNLRRRIGHIAENKRNLQQIEDEREVMQSNHYFMGRTNWDKDIVQYYCSDSQYYNCPEAIRPSIYDSKETWNYKDFPQLRIVTITQAGDLKGNEIILRTADFLKNIMHIDFVWRVAGQKEYFDRFEFRCGIRHEEVNINLLGMIPAEQIVRELAGAEFYVHPAIIDNSPNSLCEAQLIGTPVVASNVGGIPSLVEDGVTGVLYPYNEYQTLAFRLLELHGDKEKLCVISDNEKRVAHDRHDPRKLYDRVVEIYQSVYEIEEKKRRFKEK